MCVCVCVCACESVTEREIGVCSDLGSVDICSGGEFVVTRVLLASCAAACSVYIRMCIKTRPEDSWFSVTPFITLNVIQFSRLAQNTAHHTQVFQYNIIVVSVFFTQRVCCIVLKRLPEVRLNFLAFVAWVELRPSGFCKQRKTNTGRYFEISF